MSTHASTGEPGRLTRQVSLRPREWWQRGGLAVLILVFWVGVGWWGRVSSMYRERELVQEQVQEAVVSWESRAADPAAHAVSLPMTPSTAEADVALPAIETQRVAPPSDEVSSLVRWHDLLREHQLHDWQGRALSTADSPLVASAGGAVWRLEGTATYEQGVALLQSMARRFPRLVLLRVQVQQSPVVDRLQWRLELRWAAPLPALAHRWPAGGSLPSGLLINPFAPDRLVVGAITRPQGEGADRDSTQVLPLVPLHEIRLIGVMEADQDRVAVVAPASGATVSMPKSPRESRAHRLRVGHTLGVERARVISIGSTSVLLAATRQTRVGQRPDRQMTLVLATSSDASGEAGSSP